MNVFAAEFKEVDTVRRQGFALGVVNVVGDAVEGVAHRALPFAVLRAFADAGPALDAVMAGPGGVVLDGDRLGHGVVPQVEGGEGQGQRLFLERAGGQPFEELVAEGLMMTVKFAVGRDHVQMRFARGGGVFRTELFIHEAVGVDRGFGEEGDFHAEVGVIEETDDGFSSAEFNAVRLRTVHFAAAAGLPGRHDGVLDPGVRHDPQRIHVDRRLRHPHALRRVTESVDVVRHAPLDLGDLVLMGGKRQDGVVIGLRHGIRETVLLEDRVLLITDQLIGVGVFLLKPAEERRPDIEADAAEVAQLRVGAVALVVNLLIPIVVGLGARFIGDHAGAGIFTGRLIEMRVDTESFSRIGDVLLTHTRISILILDSLLLYVYSITNMKHLARVKLPKM